jgi:hypothetical protein
MSDALESLARRATGDPFFLAAPLARYAERHGLDDAALVAWLGCPPARLTDLRLCRNPHPEAPRFWQDIERIAAHFGLDAERLAAAVRFGQGLVHLSQQGANAADAPGFLMAARDEEPLPPEPGEQP